MRVHARGREVDAAHHARMNTFKKNQGHSLLDTLFVLFILAVLCGVAVSSFQSVQSSFHLQSSAEALYNAVLTTRTQALRLEKRITLCAAAPRSASPARCHLPSDGPVLNAWREGWLMFEDGNSNGLWDEGEAKLQDQAAMPRGVSVDGNTTVSHHVSFGPSGRSLALSGAFQAGTLSVCQSGAHNATGWHVVVNAFGRPRLEKSVIADCPA
jgi:type IV fimbrial biogenesis protein FimT